jgi:hypothetical protein
MIDINQVIIIVYCQQFVLTLQLASLQWLTNVVLWNKPKNKQTTSAVNDQEPAVRFNPEILLVY